MPPVIHRPSIPVPLPLSRGGLAAITAAGGRSTLELGTLALEEYQEGSFTITATGFSGTAPSGTGSYVVVAGLASIRFPYLFGASNATTFGLTGFPGLLTPAAPVVIPAMALDNSVVGMAFVRWNAGAWDVGWIAGAGFAWTASGDKQLFNPIITYPL